MAKQYLALTYDDVLVDPARSEIAANETDATSRFPETLS